MRSSPIVLCSHVPDYHFLRICSLKDICARLIKDSVIVDVEEKSRISEASSATKTTVNLQICETLVRQIASIAVSILSRGHFCQPQSMTKQTFWSKLKP